MLNLLWLIAVVLVVFWVAGMATATTAGGLIHILLLVAVIAVVYRIVAGRRVAG